ncbi:hypothetical protein E1B28_001948 [Marasmius oreades]|uniref:Transmembrane protein n=1 Tax=Marasmius oreades TaxID=181124 RepID=A0A9P8AG49_9AGAR|nr:uncharacterized protein E1B28_001948 [Marasmius oreades]KAG7100168.1 hypothetical protein E1B28_001948 [Marasmius oreades]
MQRTPAFATRTTANDNALNLPTPSSPTWADFLLLRSVSLLLFTMSLAMSYLLFTPTAATKLSNFVCIFYLVPTLLPLLIDGRPPHKCQLATMFHWVCICLHIILLLSGTVPTAPPPPVSESLLITRVLRPLYYFGTAFLLSASAITFPLIFVQGSFDAGRLGDFGHLVMRIYAALRVIYNFIAPIPKREFKMHTD